MLLFYIRHGEPIYDPDSLTPLGEEQAVALSKRLVLWGIDRIFASTSNRAIQTAKPLSEMLGKEITLLEFCHEAHAWNDFTVKTEENARTWANYHQKTKELFVDKTIEQLIKQVMFRMSIAYTTTRRDRLVLYMMQIRRKVAVQ